MVIVTESTDIQTPTTVKCILRIYMVYVNMQISYEVTAEGSNSTKYFTTYFYVVCANMCLTKI